MLLNIFLRLEEQEIEKHLTFVKKFNIALQEVDLDYRRIADLISNQEIMDQLSRAKPIYLHKTRSASYKNINKQFYKLSIFGTLLTFVLFLGFLILLPMTLQREDEINHDIQIIIDSDKAEYESTLLGQAVYDYVASNISSNFRGMTIEEHWEKTLQNLTKSHARFLKFVGENEQNNEYSKIVKILTGNVCDILQAFTPIAAAYCSKAFEGFTTKGSLQITQYMMNVLLSVKQIFDSSSRSVEDMRAALAEPSFVISDALSYSYWTPTFQEISTVVRTLLNDKLENYNKTNGLLIVFWGLFYLVFGIWWWLSIINRFSRERNSWRKMMRLVPISIVSRNKILKNFIIKSSNSELTVNYF